MFWHILFVLEFVGFSIALTEDALYHISIPAIDSLLDFNMLRKYHVITISPENVADVQEKRIYDQDQTYPFTRVTVDAAQNVTINKAQCSDPSTSVKNSPILINKPYLYVVEPGVAKRAVKIFSKSIYNCTRDIYMVHDTPIDHRWVEFDLGVYDLDNAFVYFANHANATDTHAAVFSNPSARRHPNVAIATIYPTRLRIHGFSRSQEKIVTLTNISNFYRLGQEEGKLQETQIFRKVILKVRIKMAMLCSNTVMQAETVALSLEHNYSNCSQKFRLLPTGK